MSEKAETLENEHQDLIDKLPELKRIKKELHQSKDEERLTREQYKENEINKNELYDALSENRRLRNVMLHDR